MFEETPDIWTWVGGSVIFTSTIYIAHRESQNKEKNLSGSMSNKEMR